MLAGGVVRAERELVGEPDVPMWGREGVRGREQVAGFAEGGEVCLGTESC